MIKCPRLNCVTQAQEEVAIDVEGAAVEEQEVGAPAAVEDPVPDEEVAVHTQPAEGEEELKVGRYSYVQLKADTALLR